MLPLTCVCLRHSHRASDLLSLLLERNYATIADDLSLCEKTNSIFQLISPQLLSPRGLHRLSIRAEQLPNHRQFPFSSANAYFRSASVSSASPSSTASPPPCMPAMTPRRIKSSNTTTDLSSSPNENGLLRTRSTGEPLRAQKCCKSTPFFPKMKATWQSMTLRVGLSSD